MQPPTNSKKNEIHKDTQISKPILSCESCNYKTTDRSNLKKHVQSIHEGKKEHCNECLYAASSKGNLKKHITNKHAKMII